MKKFAVIGSPISHSLSPSIHTAFAKMLGVGIQYDAIEVKLENFEEQLNHLFSSGYSGLNVTLPLKEKAFSFSTKRSEICSLTKSANTLWREDGVLFADSTDGKGLMEDLISKGLTVEGSNIVILGAGGSAKAILPSLLEAKPNEIFILNRTLSKAEEIVEIYINNTTKITAGPLNEKLPFKSDGIINTTSAGLLGQEIVCPENLFADQAWCYDLNYADATTNFNKLAKKHKISKAYDGMGMLFRQAALSFEIWTDLTPDVDKAVEMLKK